MDRARGRKEREMRGNVRDKDKEGRLSGLGVQLGADVTAIRRYRRPSDRFFSDDVPAARKHIDESNVWTELLGQT